MVGAGFSKNAVLPVGKEMPLWSELGNAFASEIGDYSATNALDAISAFEHEYGRPKMIERLSEALLLGEARPGTAHQAFCSIPFDLVCTTNFDFLLERQYESIPRVCNPLIDEEQLSISLRESGVALLKLHGDLRHPARLVATETDYDRFLDRYPMLATYLSNLLITRTAVLIGYSLDDPDFRQLWQVVGERLGHSRRMAYAVAVGAKPTDISRFERRGVKVINLPAAKGRYGEVLAEAFSELRDYWRAAVIPSSQVKEEQSLRELSLPPDAQSRLCFVAVPLALQSFYRERIFPLVREAGFVPVTADDVVSPGDTILPKIDALIGRALLMIVDATSDFTLAEFRLGVKKLPEARVLLVSEQPEQLQAERVRYRALVRPSIASEEIEAFLEQVGGWLARAAEELRPSLVAEPARLLAVAEYRAAVISAISLLESLLRRRIDVPVSWSSRRRVLSLRELIEVAAAQELLTNIPPQTVLDWLRIRNEIVHSDRTVTKAQATQIVSGVAALAQQLQ